MLTFFTGKDRIGLSQSLLFQISDYAKQGISNQFLIVPEQFSHEAERKLCMYGGPAINRYAEVLSMSRLSDRVASICGGAAESYLDKGGQLLAMAAAAEQVSSKIKLYASVLRKPEFLSGMVKMIDEFQSYCLQPQALIDASSSMDGFFSQKLLELGYLYEAYLSVCANGKADPSDKLLRLIEELSENNWAEDKIFYIDGYSDFTGSELEVLDQLIRQAKEVCIALVLPDDNLQAETTASDTRKILTKLAEQNRVKVAFKHASLQSDRSEELNQLLSVMFSSSKIQRKLSKNVHLYQFLSVEAECMHTVSRIQSLLGRGVRCREISVACTDPALYRAPLSAAFSSAGIPFYLSGENDILSSPIIGAVLSALSAATGPMEYEEVALYLKSGLPDMEQDRIDRLDNYAYLWNLHGGQWEKPLDKHPRGFGLTWEDADREALQQLEQTRSAVMKPFLAFRKALLRAKQTGEMAECFYQFLESLKLRERLEQEANQQLQSGNKLLGQQLFQIYEIITQSLEQTWLIVGDTVREPEDFYHLYQMLLSQYQIGTIPIGLDQVQISDLPDLRYRSTRHLFVLGASDGAFPAYQGADGVLTEEERKQLILAGLPVAPGRAEQMEREIGRIYAALSSATATIDLSYSGEQPAWLFRRAVELYPDSYCQQPDILPLSIDAYAAWKLRHHYEEPSGNLQLDQVQNRLNEHISYQFTALQQRTVQRLYGQKLNLSASKIDRYASCRFSFFLMYGLRAQPKKQAKLDAPAFGTFVHEVLEHTVQKVSKLGGFPTVEEETILEIALEEINEYAVKYFPEQTQRDLYLFKRSKDEVLEIVHDLWDELSHSKFQPAACELGFSDTGEMPAVEVQGQKAICKLSGFVDRIDLYEEHGKTYVRVVDYKTGPKAFDYTDILNGAGLQMLIYLFALRQYGGQYLNYGDLEPAGVLYMPAKKQFILTEAMPDDSTVQKAHQKNRKRQGLVREDDNLLAAMEADPEHPVFLPYEVKKGGKLGDLADQRQMILLERHVLRSIAEIADGIVSGNVIPNPVVRGQTSSCTYCDYRTVCHKDLGTQEVREFAKTSASVFWEKLEQEEHEHG